MEVGAIIVLTLGAGSAMATVAVALKRLLQPMLSSSRCPTCRGLGTIQLRDECGLAMRYRCPDCNGNGTLAAVVPDRLPKDW